MQEPFFLDRGNEYELFFLYKIHILGKCFF